MLRLISYLSMISISVSAGDYMLTFSANMVSADSQAVWCALYKQSPGDQGWQVLGMINNYQSDAGEEDDRDSGAQPRGGRPDLGGVEGVRGLIPLQQPLQAHLILWLSHHFPSLAIIMQFVFQVMRISCNSIFHSCICKD